MYTRNYSKTRRYSPPPGYAGNTFSGNGEVKHHLPADEVTHMPKETVLPAENEPPTHDAQITQEEKRVETVAERDKSTTPLHELLNHLRGRFGSEELIILTVMLLIAQDGIGAEVLILALILIAG